MLLNPIHGLRLFSKYTFYSDCKSDWNFEHFSWLAEGHEQGFFLTTQNGEDLHLSPEWSFSERMLYSLHFKGPTYIDLCHDVNAKPAAPIS